MPLFSIADEMAQTPLFPSMLFFCGEHAAAKDGETPLCRSDILLKQMEELAESIRGFGFPVQIGG